MSRHEVVLIPGDGIGPEVSKSACAVIDAAGVDIHWNVFEVGSAAIEKGGDSLPLSLLDSIRDSGSALKGPVTTPVGKGFKSVNVSLRKELDLFANVRPVKSLPGLITRFQDVDLVIIRENTEGLYIGEESWENPDSVIALKRVTRQKSRRIADFSVDFARANHRKKITIVHKANILKESDGLFLDTAREVCATSPDIQCTDRIVDALAMDLVIDPGRHDVLLCPNLYGDIISDLAAGLVGGLGLIPGANLGLESAVFEAVHGSAPDIAGQGIANPTALILAGVMLLNYLGESAAAHKIHESIEHLYRVSESLTPDVGGKATTTEFTEALIKIINR